MDTKKKVVYQEVYPFATENIGQYFKELELKDKTLLTVGSSLDQAFNALLLDAKHITVYDMNANTEAFYKLKKEAILNTKREDLYQTIITENNIKLTKDYFPESISKRINPYLQTDAAYEKLREKLTENEISFITGDIFSMTESLKGEKFDTIVLSNILQFLDYFSKSQNKGPYALLQEGFYEWKDHLNKDGILQLLYLYSFSISDVNKKQTIPTYNLKNVATALKGNSLDISFFDGCQVGDTDAIVTYTKKRK